MTFPDALASQGLQEPSLVKEVQFLAHRIRQRPPRVGWISFVARQGQGPTIVLAPDREALIIQSRELIRRRCGERK